MLRTVHAAALALLLVTSTHVRGGTVVDRAPDHDYYLAMPDGTRIAVSVWLPARAGAQRVPVLLYQTRYGRQSANARKNAALLLPHEYAVVFVDVRGTTASFGERAREITQEAEDMGPLLRHLADQPWCDGRVVAVGQSYLADTADLATARSERALRGAVVRQSEFDVYLHAMQPGGVQNRWLLSTYDEWTLQMDVGRGIVEGRDVDCVRTVSDCRLLAPTITPVRDDANADALRAALLDRRRWRARDFPPGAFRDDTPPGGDPLYAWSPATRLPAIRARAAPVQYWGSWMDAGTAEAALARFRSTPDAPVQVWITANDHNGRLLTDPLQPDATTPIPSWDEQQSAMRRFVATVLDSSDVTRGIAYLPLGAQRMRWAPAWPPAGVADHRFNLAPGGRLLANPPTESAERRAVDFDVTAGTETRWSAQLNIAAAYPDRRDLAHRVLTYDTPPFTEDVEVAGYVRLRLRMSAESTDPVVHAYLEDVAPDGRVSYLTEGHLRLVHRLNVAKASLPYDQGPDRHSYRRRDASEVLPGVPLTADMSLFPIAARVRAGHRLRISIAGADADAFARYSAGGPDAYTVHYGRRGSSVLIPWRRWSERPETEFERRFP